MNANTIVERAVQVQALQVQLANLAMQVPTPPDNALDSHHIGYQEFGLSFHHALALTSLVKIHDSELAASAFALARPMLETLQRGWWFTTCATEAQTQAFIENDAFPIRQVTDVGLAVDALAPFTGTGYFTRLNQAEWNVYHSFTHGGLMALDAYGNRPNLSPDYAPDGILALLDNAQRMSAMAALGMAWIGLIYQPGLTRPIYDAINELGPEIGQWRG
ncbi:hypothetical protein J7J08_13145 [Stenotrophomonas sp. ISL-67]|uniref:DUF6988 family protein n=1 Tax=Stenotrophomonas sp. ISL-67 TaxID=2819171 RepID=UPI001BECAB81|nr:hypothetical protein [Stenotrophomonas sp. ISL-67]MBT2768585.1 hypothetical protein [Stenotrophomonas sp. ISL-67]